MNKLVFALIITLAACSKKKEAPPAPPPAPTPAPTPVVTADAAAAGSAAGSGSAQAADVDVPTEVDFEDQASKDIDDKNVEAHVKAIEQDLSQQ